MAYFHRSKHYSDSNKIEVTAFAPHNMTAEQQQCWLDVINATDALFTSFEKEDSQLVRDRQLVRAAVGLAPKLTAHRRIGLIEHPFEPPPDGVDYCDRLMDDNYICGWPRRDHEESWVSYNTEDPIEPPEGEDTGVAVYVYDNVRRQDDPAEA